MTMKFETKIDFMNPIWNRDAWSRMQGDLNPENEKIMIWLREREIDRMLKMELQKECVRVEDARSDLHVDKMADSAAIRKTWRTLMGFLNADVGRSQERAIHRKKDEIAKHLQSARDLLIQKIRIG